MNLNVIPLGLGDKGKAPSCGGGWQNPENFQTNNTLVRTTKPDMYGVLCGKHNNIIVIDYDIHKLEETSINLESLKGVHGSTAYIVETQSGGFHVYHTYEDKYECWGGICGVQGYIDIRNTGNYVVGAKSTGYRQVSGNIERLTPMPDNIFQALDASIKTMRETKTRKKTHKLYQAEEQDALVELLEDFGFTNVEFKWKNTPYNFDCDQVGFGQACPCCNQEHENNNFFYWIVDDMEIYVKNHSEGCEEKVMRSYKAVKYLFERKVCRIDKTLTFIVEKEKPFIPALDEDTRDGRIQPQLRLDYYNDHKIKLLFAYMKYEEDGKVHKFMPRWLEDRNQRKYDIMDFYPENCPENVFNTWRGYAVENIDPALGQRGSADKFVELVEVISGGYSKYVLDYYSLLFQQPGTKPRTCLVFRGKAGCGKGVHLGSMEILMGVDLFFETNKAQVDVFGNHALAFDCNKLVAMNEASMKYNLEHKQTLLSLISDIRGVRINPKNIQDYVVRNLAGTIMCSNDKVVVYVDEDDRRFAIFETSTKYRNDQVWFAEYEKYMLKPENQRAIYDFLMSRDISGVDWVKDRPKTRAFLEMRNSNLSLAMKWFVGFIDNYPWTYHDITHGRVERANVHRWKADDLSRTYPHTPSDKDPARHFGVVMKDMVEKYDVPQTCLRKEKKDGVIVWTIDHQACKSWLEEREFLLPDRETLETS